MRPSPPRAAPPDRARRWSLPGRAEPLDPDVIGVTPTPPKTSVAASANPAEPHTKTVSTAAAEGGRSATVIRPGGRGQPSGGTPGIEHRDLRPGQL